MAKVYLETTIISYLAARPSGDLIVAGHQHLTDEWWHARRPKFEVFVSQYVIDEAAQGDPEAAQRRLHLLRGLALLSSNDRVVELARRLVDEGAIPPSASQDAVHIAMATVHGMDYLLTWNCRHIANAEIIRAVTAICHDMGYDPPLICTPEELMGV